jgi:uncharacterized membrane-anchored protein
LKQPLLSFVLGLLTIGSLTAGTPTDSAAIWKAKVDSVHATLHYQTGLVSLPDNVGELTIPTGFRYLDPTQSQRVLTQIWGNPDGESLGMLFPATQGPLDQSSYAFVIEYEEMGYVKDDDADEIDYDELLTEMKADTEEANKEREAQGYEPFTLIGWAAKPYYDKEKKALHWAKELQFGNADQHTLNYNVRLLGRKGVLVLNAVGATTQLAEIRQNIPSVIQSVSFTKGLRYAEFNPDLDEVAAYSIGGLVAGKVLAKVGFFALILKFWKVGLALLAGGFTAIRRFFGKKTNENAPQNLPNVEQPPLPQPGA